MYKYSIRVFDHVKSSNNTHRVDEFDHVNEIRRSKARDSREFMTFNFLAIYFFKCYFPGKTFKKKVISSDNRNLRFLPDVIQSIYNKM